ncbi:leucine-rich repeat domain-containing protein [Promethearchaeum syntrophicum]|uniref:Leucine-rich repeat domain-containing protein n=1 Tax=Promethearchaeum syntrophicum TaxID=2594042 RepID=A0A5B9DBF0_9ARCH|nr:leucine-rich repeat domain-containing protein [Candidatus Prometheoarchaeum syntrophicum]QEE16579.1 hypothetical protein DSAG12_02409 [Candidatus Prometheoarchaeum syntrophicum]
MSKTKSTKKTNIVSTSYVRNQARRKVLQTEAKREREGRKLGFFLLKNQFRENYGLLKWDLLLTILLLAAFFWGRGLTFLAIIVYLQIYVASYFIFNYRKYRLAPFIMSFSILPFIIYIMSPNFERYLDPDLMELFKSSFLFSTWAILSYGAFWFIIIYKNRREYQNAQEKELCLVCGKQKEDFVIHMGHFLCKECYLEQAYKLKNFNGIDIYMWDYEVLSYLEHQIGEKIPNYNLTEENNIFKPEFENKLFFSVEENSVTAISIPNKRIKLNLPEEIGLLHTLRFLNFPGNQISKLPYSMRTLFQLKFLNLKNNPLEYLPGHSLKSLTLLKRRGCNILR